MFDFILFFLSISFFLFIMTVMVMAIIRRGNPHNIGESGDVMGYYIDGLPSAIRHTGEPRVIGPVGIGFIVNATVPLISPYLVGPANCPVRAAYREDIRKTLEGAYDGDVMLINNHHTGLTVARVTARVIQAQHRTGWWARGMSVSEKTTQSKAKARW